jgi:hypothetical protein
VGRDLYFGSLSSFPDETHSILVVDSNAMLARAVAFQHLESITGQLGEVCQASGLVENHELSIRDPLDVRETPFVLSLVQVFRIGALKAPDHESPPRPPH